MTFFCDLEPVSFTFTIRIPCHLTLVYLALLPLAATEGNIGMIRGWLMIDVNSSFTPALMPVSPLRNNLPSELNSRGRPNWAISDGEIPCTICRAMSDVLLLLLPISTVPRLPG